MLDGSLMSFLIYKLKDCPTAQILQRNIQILYLCTLIIVSLVKKAVKRQKKCACILSTLHGSQSIIGRSESILEV